MKRAKFDEAAQLALTDCVKKIETTTDAELVLTVRARSGSYRHADLLLGSLLAFIGLLFLLFSPFHFHEYWVVIDVALLFLLGFLVSSRSNSIRRLLTTKKFRNQAVRTGAAATFTKRVSPTRPLKWVCFYLSILERRLELIADRGVLKGVDALEWNQVLFELHEAGRNAQPQALSDGLEHLGTLLAKHLPATGENPNELPDAPRFELK